MLLKSLSYLYNSRGEDLKSEVTDQEIWISSHSLHKDFNNISETKTT